MRVLFLGVLAASATLLTVASCEADESGVVDAGPPSEGRDATEPGTKEDGAPVQPIPGRPDAADAAPIDAGPVTASTFTTDPVNVWVRVGAQVTLEVHVARKGLTGDVAVSAMGLPRGVTAQPVTVPAASDSATLTLVAAADAQHGAARITLAAAGVTPKEVPVVVAGPPGALDRSFGVDGVVIDNAGESGWFAAAALQPDGKIVAVGSRVIADAGAGYAVRRYFPDGAPDIAFNVAVAPLVPSSGGATSLAFDPSGDLLVSGYARIVRISPSQTLVTSFADGGTLFVDGSTLNGGVPLGYTVLGQGDAGVLTTSFLYRFGSRVDRFTAGGERDSTFTTYGNNFASAYSLTRLPSGKTFVAGYRTTSNAPHGVRLSPAGTVDGTISLLGGVKCSPSIATTSPDGDAVYVGFNADMPGIVCMARFAADGDGRARFVALYPPLRAGYFTRFGPGLSAGHPGIAVGSNGGIYYETQATDGGDKSASVHGHLGDGAADPTFGEAGVGPVFEDPASPDTYSYDINGVVATPDGRLVLVGARRGVQAGYFLARLWL